MINNKLFLVCMFLFLVSSVIATTIEVNPSSMNINLTKGAIKQINVTVTNLHNYSLHDIKAEGNLVVNEDYVYDTELVSNENISILVDIKSDEVGTFSSSINIIGKKYGVCSDTHIVNITASGELEPDDITINNGDYITFKNNYMQGITIQVHDGRSYIDVPYNSEAVGNRFEQSGLIEYTVLKDSIPIITGDVHVGECLVHHSGVLTLNVVSRLEETVLQIDFYNTNFTMDYSDKTNDMFTIRNVGSKIAKNIEITGDWITIINDDDKKFDLDVNTPRGIEFRIEPSFFHLFQTSDTNRSYVKTITINGDNIIDYVQNIDIFINYKEVDADDVTSAEWWVSKKEMCDAYPDSPLCISEPRTIYENHTIYDAPDILTNMSPADVLNYFKAITGLEGKWETYNNQWKADTDTMKNTISSNQLIANQSLAANLENEKSFNSFKNVFYIIFGTFIFLIMGSGIGFIFYKYYVMRTSQREGKV